MILLFGGTGETAGLATALAGLGGAVTVSTATDAALDVGAHPLIRRRCGRLDDDGMLALIESEGVRVVVDAAHPFAAELHRTVARAAERAGAPLIRFQRENATAAGDNLFYVDSHDEAAALAVSFAAPVLLTTGSRNLSPYVKAARRRGVPLFARVLPHPDSEAACEAAGLPESARIFARGPFDIGQNRELIGRCRAGVLVTKESGRPGGFPEKIAAAALENCQVVVIRRPPVGPPPAAVCHDVAGLVEAVGRLAVTAPGIRRPF